MDDRGVDRRTLLLGAAGALVAASTGAGSAYARPVTKLATPRFDPALARRLHAALVAALHDPSVHFPGGILHVRSPRLGAWTGAAGLGRVAPPAPMRTGDRFRGGSIVKMFVSSAALQLVERRRLSLDDRLPDLLPASVVDRFPTAGGVTVRMLLSHRSGIPEWESDAVDAELARNPTKIWRVSEFLDLAAAQPPLFAPGTAFSYSNTNYILLGLIIDRTGGRAWREQVTRRVIEPLRLTHTYLPAPGHPSIRGPHAHGYAEFEGRFADITRVDPSFAGSSGAAALVTTVADLARFLDALFAGRLFRSRQTLRQMLTFAPAQGEGGLIGYGLGVERRALPGGVDLVGHLGGAPGYRSYVGRMHPSGATIALALNTEEDPTPLVLPVVQALAA